MKSGELTIDELERWLLFGAHWQVVDISGAQAEVEFCTCTGDPLELRKTRDPDVSAKLERCLVRVS